MKGTNGIQVQVYTPFIDFIRKIQEARVVLNKEQRGKEVSGKRLSLTIVKYFLHDKKSYKTLINADIDLSEGKELKTTQFQAHPVFIDFKRQLKNDRIKKDKEGNGELTDKRLSITLVKYFENNPLAYNLLLNADIRREND